MRSSIEYKTGQKSIIIKIQMNFFFNIKGEEKTAKEKDNALICRLVLLQIRNKQRKLT